MDDIQPGCERAVAALRGWTEALGRRDFDYLEKVLDTNFQFTCDPAIGGGRLSKERFIAMDRHIYDAKIDLLSVTARRFGDMVTMLSFANASEEFRGDLGPGMPTADEMNARVSSGTLAYGTAWREGADGEWRCESHHIFGSTAG